jgi:hypothetical protein
MVTAKGSWNNLGTQIREMVEAARAWNSPGLNLAKRYGK